MAHYISYFVPNLIQLQASSWAYYIICCSELLYISQYTQTSLIYMTDDNGGSEVSYQAALLGKGEIGLQGHDHNEGEKEEDVKEAATETSNVGLVKEGADQVTEGQDAQTVVTEVQEKEEAIAVWEDAAVLQHQCDDEDGEY